MILNYVVIPEFPQFRSPRLLLSPQLPCLRHLFCVTSRPCGGNSQRSRVVLGRLEGDLA